MNEIVEQLIGQYNVLSITSLDEYFNKCDGWLRDTLTSLRKDEFELDERVVFTLGNDDIRDESTPNGKLLTILHRLLYEIDITPCFVILVTTNASIAADLAALQSQGVEIIEGIVCEK